MGVFSRFRKPKLADAINSIDEYISSEPDKQMPLELFLASPFFMFRVADTLKSVEGHSPEEKFIILLTALREIGGEFPPDVRKEQWGKAVTALELLRDGG